MEKVWSLLGLFTATILIGNPSAVDAAIIAGWYVGELPGGLNDYGPSPYPSTISDTNVLVLGLARGAGVSTSYTAKAGGWGGVAFTSSTAADAIASGQFATLAITPNSGYAVSFSSISRFDYFISPTGPAYGLLQFSIAAGNFVDVTNFVYSATDWGGSINAIDLSGIPALQNVSANVTFRIVNYGGGAQGKWYIYNTLNIHALNFALEGIVSQIPPAAPTLGLTTFTNHLFTFRLTGAPGTNYVVQAATNLAAGWISIATNPAPFTFTETNADLFSQRFYRGLWQP